MTGEVVYLYAFDVANEIDISNITSVLGQKPFLYEIETRPPQPKDMPLHRPLAIAPGQLPNNMRGQAIHWRAAIHEVGVITFAMRVQFAVERLTELSTFHNPKLDNGQSLDTVAQQLCVDFCRDLGDRLIQANPTSSPEAYTVFCLTD